MNREIKFKGLRTDGKGWVYGSYIEFKGESDIMVFFDTTSKRKHEYKHIFLDKHLIAETIMPDEQGWDYGSQIRFHEVIPESVGQFTGLHDKNGVEIYEGKDSLELHLIGLGRGFVDVRMKDGQWNIYTESQGYAPLFEMLNNNNVELTTHTQE